MRILILTSTSFRHQYFVEHLKKKLNVVGVFVEEKKHYYSNIRNSSRIIRQHFSDLQFTEEKWFGSFSGADDLHVVPEINQNKVVNMAIDLKPDCICLFGTSILKNKWLQHFKNRIINLHLGLSPFYRGSATLFWPFVFKELHYLGSTIHLAIDKVDAGSILINLPATFVAGENYYNITNRLIRDSIHSVPLTVVRYLNNEICPIKQDISLQKRLCKKIDFNETALRKMLLDYRDGISQKEINKIKEMRCHYLQ